MFNLMAKKIGPSFPIPASEMCLLGQWKIEQANEYRQAMYCPDGLPPDGMHQLRAQSGPVMHSLDQNKLGALLRQTRLSAGFSARQVARALAIATPTYIAYERGEVLDTSSIVVYGACALLNIRYNCLPFQGPPLSSVRDIAHDLERRCFALGLDPASEEFEHYTGYRYFVLVRRLYYMGMDSELFDILTNRFHMRVLPPKADRVLSDDMLSEMVANFKHLLDCWNMSFADAHKFMGISYAGLLEYLKNPTRHGKIVWEICKLMGDKPHYLPDNLPDHEHVCWCDKSLLSAMDSQLTRLGWSRTRVSEELGFRHDAFAEIEDDLLRGEGLSGKWAMRTRESLMKICALLKIRVYELQTVPFVHVPLGPDWRGHLPKLLALLRKRWQALRLTQDEVRNLLSHMSSATTTNDILAGNITDKNLMVFEELLLLFHIETNPWELWDEQIVSANVKRIELGRLIRDRLSQGGMLSPIRLARLAGISNSEKGYIVHGYRDPSRREVRRLLAVLGMSLEGDETPVQTYLQEAIDWHRRPYQFGPNQTPPSSSKQEWCQRMTGIFLETGHSVSSVCHFFGCDRSAVENIFTGNFVWNDPLVIRLSEIFRMCFVNREG
ncbi:MAG: hypothetical protein ACD_62C00043G0006 [uncultured bacterium]|nr:MAG: hypothetical protein ACD_62C00043G0006 [uncultured bacterium]